jgi:hypothetical protein
MSSLDRPDTRRPISKDERVELRARIVSADARLERIGHYRDEPETHWPADIRLWFSRTPVAGESAKQVLNRWWALFEDEVNLVHQVRNRVVHYAAVTDAELLNADWLITRLMRTLEPTDT